jgi:hypothetical protein
MPIIIAEPADGNSQTRTATLTTPRLPEATTATLVLSGTCFRAPNSGSNDVGLRVAVNGIPRGEAHFFSNEEFTHRTVPTLMVQNVPLQDGVNTIDVEPATAATVIDNNDHFFLMLVN